MASDKVAFTLSKPTIVAIDQYRREHGLKKREDVIELAIALLLESQRAEDADETVEDETLEEPADEFDAELEFGHGFERDDDRW